MENLFFIEVLTSIKIMTNLIASSQLSHAERRRQLQLLSDYIDAQIQRIIPHPPAPEPSFGDVLKQINGLEKSVGGISTTLESLWEDYSDQMNRMEAMNDQEPPDPPDPEPARNPFEPEDYDEGDINEDEIPF